MSEAEILAAYQGAFIHAKRVARGQLDDDACLSEAGLAVTLALQCYDVALGASLTTYSCRKVRGLVLNLIKKNARCKGLSYDSTRIV